MPKKKQRGQKKDSSLGHNLVRTRFQGVGRQQRGHAGDHGLVHTSDLNDGYDWGRLGATSITEQSDLSEFLSTAELAGTEFTAEKLNVTVITEMTNEALLTEEQKASKEAAEEKYRHRIRVPRRPEWTRTMSAEMLQQSERENFLQWRRSLSQLAEVDDLLLTPFERNLDFWRQLWRVIERSHVVVQIVDARDPLLFRCEDLDNYVKEVGPFKKTLLLVNKADLLSETQRSQWAEHFSRNHVQFAFFSAVLESEKNQEDARARRQEEMAAGEPDALPFELDLAGLLREQQEKDEAEAEAEAEAGEAEVGEAEAEAEAEEAEARAETQDPAQETGREEREVASGAPQTPADGAAVAEEVAAAGPPAGASPTAPGAGSQPPGEAAQPAEAGAGTAPARDAAAPNATEGGSLAAGMKKRGLSFMYDCDTLVQLFKELASARENKDEVPVIGLVGYPNVGKSSTINALCRRKMVSVSATPGKTKHFQTLVLGDVTLCDCPGLVFPNFANTKAQLVCNGILPVDQLRDVIPPTTYVVQHIPRGILESTYGVQIIKPAPDDPHPNRPPTAAEFLNAYSFARGFMNARGAPDISRGARYILKDFVSGKLLFCKSPPGYEQLVSKAPGVAGEAVAEFHENRSVDSSWLSGPRHAPSYANEVDDDFFKAGQVKAISLGVRGVSDYTRGDVRGPAAAKSDSKKKHQHKKNKKEKSRRVNPGVYH